MRQEDRIEIYTIPPNFAEEGTLLSGRIRTKNAVETAVMLLVLLPLLFSLETSTKGKMYLGMIVLVPVVILGIIGVQGESLFAFISSFFRYLLRRRILTVPDEQYRLEQNRRRGKRKGEREGHVRQKGRRGKTDHERKKAPGHKTSETEKPNMEERTAAGQKEGKKRAKKWIGSKQDISKTR